MEEREFNLLYLKYKNSILKYIYKRTNDIEISEDLTHDVFAKFIEATRKGIYIENGFLKTYLFTLSHNLTLNYLNSKHYKNSVRTFHKNIHLF